MSSTGPPRKAVIPAARLGTRLPATKAVPKELPRVVDTPAIQYIVEAAARAGLTEVLLVARRANDRIADHVDHAPQLELEAAPDAMRAVAQAREPVHGTVFRGRRHDTGDRGDHLRAVVGLPHTPPDIGPEFRRWLEDVAAGPG
jgi:UTP-glucose-1-phosphate uridylyltransferase